MKRIIILSISLLFLFAGCSSSYEHQVKGKTIEEIFLKDESLRKTDIIHKEKVDGGILVFYIPFLPSHSEFESKLGFVFAEKNLWGWTVSNKRGMYVSGERSDIIFECIPAKYGRPFPLYFGEIMEPSITKVIVSDENKGAEALGTIVQVRKFTNNNRAIRIWFALTEISPGPSTKIKGLNSENNVVVTLETEQPSISTKRID